MIEVKRYTEDDKSIWNRFVSSEARNATFLHTREFFLHNPLNQIDDCSLLFYKKNKIIAVIPATLYTNTTEQTIFHSHKRSTYGGFVLGKGAGVEDGIEIVSSTITFAKNHNIDEIIIRNPFRFYNRLPSDETDYAMWYHGFTIKAREIESTIVLNSNAQLLYEDGTKRSIKKAKNATITGFSENFFDYWKILTSNLLSKHNAKPVHNIDEFLSLYNLVGGEHIKLVTAEIDLKIIGGIILFINGTVLHAQYIASDSTYQELRPINAIIDFIITWGLENKFTHFNLGSGNENGGRTINTGLFRFKEGFGGRGILRETMNFYIK